mmetsp:Transcript_34409/g.79550  ORF Transcript_34409/g.79550 Transcript_34409/m.79550 type:complete len:246 (-) Transcript_34409:114-851(-)
MRVWRRTIVCASSDTLPSRTYRTELKIFSFDLHLAPTHHLPETDRPDLRFGKSAGEKRTEVRRTAVQLPDPPFDRYGPERQRTVKIVARPDQRAGVAPDAVDVARREMPRDRGELVHGKGVSAQSVAVFRGVRGRGPPGHAVSGSVDEGTVIPFRKLGGGIGTMAAVETQRGQGRARIGVQVDGGAWVGTLLPLQEGEGAMGMGDFGASPYTSDGGESDIRVEKNRKGHSDDFLEQIYDMWDVAK